MVFDICFQSNFRKILYFCTFFYTFCTFCFKKNLLLTNVLFLFKKLYILALPIFNNTTATFRKHIALSGTFYNKNKLVIILFTFFRNFHKYFYIFKSISRKFSNSEIPSFLTLESLLLKHLRPPYWKCNGSHPRHREKQKLTFVS